MKFSKLSLMPLLALALVACNVVPSSSSSVPGTSEPPTSASVSETSTTESVPQSSEEEPVQTDWSDAEKKLFKKWLAGNVIPYAPVKGATLLEIDDPTIGPPLLAYIKPEGATAADLNGYCDALVAGGYADATEEFGGNETTRFIYGELANTEYNESVIIVGELYEGMFLSQFIYDIDVREWQGDMISINVEAILGIADVVIPAPEFTFTNLDYYPNKTETKIIVDIYCEGNKVPEYEATLTKAGWVKDENGKWHDPAKLVHVSVLYFEKYKCISLEIEAYVSPDAPKPTEWTAEDKELMGVFLNDNVLPYVYIEGAILAVGQDPTTEEYFLVYTKQENATQADLDAYVEGLISAGYVDITEEIGGDASNKFLLGQLANEDCNEQVLVYAWYEDGMFMAQFEYDIDIRTWPSEEIDGAVAALFETTVTIPAPAFEFLDVTLDFDAELGALIIDLDCETDPSQSYAETLVAAGWQLIPDKGNSYVDATGSIMIAFQYSAEVQILRIIVVSLAPAPQA